MAIIAVYVIASSLYGLLSEAPWDDDCVARYFHTQEMWAKPGHFFSSWNRPLFMFAFAGTAWMGRTVMMFQMILIGALAGWWLFRALEERGARNAWMVLPLFLFQTFHFSVSRNFLTEPIAVAVICLGLYAMARQRWVLFALAGGLLPLARLELAVVLPFWALALVQARQWRPIVLLGLPTVVLMVAGYFVKPGADLLWLVDETLGKEGKNRYGNREIGHYFERFAFVTGPVVFYFMAIGLLERLARLRADVFIILQATAIMGLYVLFSTSLNTGNSAGFLRNLIPLTPFVALMAFDGLQAWQKALSDRAPTEVAATRPEERDRPERVQRKSKARAQQRKAHDPKAKAKTPTPKGWSTLRVHLLSILAVAVLAIGYDKALLHHHKISDQVDHTPALIAGVFALLLLIGRALLRERTTPPWLAAGTATLVALTTLGHTMATERPDAHLNPERKGITELATLYKDSYLREWPLYANHPWFFWVHDLGYPDAGRYRVLNKAALDTADVHSIALWENHYSHRLQGDVQLNDMYARRDWVELCHLVSDDHRLRTGLFQKVDTVAGDREQLRARFLAAHGSLPYGHYAHALELHRDKRFPEALQAALATVQADSTFVEGVLQVAQAHFSMRSFESARARFEKALAMDTSLFSLHYSIGACDLNMGRNEESVASIKKVLRRDKTMKQAYEVLAGAYYNLQLFDSAEVAYNGLLGLDPKNVSALVNRGASRHRSQKLDLAMADYDAALRLDPGNATVLLNRAVLLVQKGEKEAGCGQLAQLADAGNMTALQYRASLCR